MTNCWEEDQRGSIWRKDDSAVWDTLNFFVQYRATEAGQLIISNSLYALWRKTDFARSVLYEEGGIGAYSTVVQDYDWASDFGAEFSASSRRPEPEEDGELRSLLAEVAHLPQGMAALTAGGSRHAC